MTLLSALRATKVLGLAVALVASGMMTAEAGDGWGSSDHGHHHRSKWLPSIELPGHGGRLSTVFHSGESENRVRQDGDFHAGTFATYGIRANSIYFYVDNMIEGRDGRETSRRSEPKVITVAPGQNDCSWEAGVCVIRPSW